MKLGKGESDWANHIRENGCLSQWPMEIHMVFLQAKPLRREQLWMPVASSRDLVTTPVHQLKGFHMVQCSQPPKRAYFWAPDSGRGKETLARTVPCVVWVHHSDFVTWTWSTESTASNQLFLLQFFLETLDLRVHLAGSPSPCGNH